MVEANAKASATTNNTAYNASYGLYNASKSPIPPAPPAPALPRNGIDQPIHVSKLPLNTPAPMLSRDMYPRQPTPPTPPSCQPAQPAIEPDIEEDVWLAWKIWKLVETIGVNIMLGFCVNAVFKEYVVSTSFPCSSTY